VPRRSHSFVLDADPATVREAASRAIAELGWYASDTGGGFDVREDPTGLCCTMSPVEATVRFWPATSGTLVDIEVYVPGFGPIPKRQLADRAIGLEQRITRWTGPAGSVPR
jgi:hypothetical protein